MRLVRGRSGVVAALLAAGLVLALTGCAPARSSAIAVPEPLATVTFWKIIDAARGTADPIGRSTSPSALSRQLTTLSDTEVAAFAVRYDVVMVQLDRWTVWDAGYAAAQGMGDDDFDYFRAWLIGKGQAAVLQAESDPEGLVRYLTAAAWSKDGFENEPLDYVADDILTKRRGQAADDAFDSKTGATVDDDPAGKEPDENTIEARYPLLAAWATAHEH
jgi:hypothetical protein